MLGVQAKLLADTNAVLAMEGDKEQAVNDLKKEMNTWTSRYRTDGKVGGRPSFGMMYSAVNALAGHWTSFGADAPIPKKRFARIQKVCCLFLIKSLRCNSFARIQKVCCPVSLTTKTRHLDRLGQLGEFEQDSSTDPEQESNTDSHSARTVSYTHLTLPTILLV